MFVLYTATKTLKETKEVMKRDSHDNKREQTSQRSVLYVSVLHLSETMWLIQPSKVVREFHFLC